MSRIEVLRRELVRLEQTEAMLRRRLAQQEEAAANARAAAARHRQSVRPSTPPATQQRALRFAEDQDRKGVAAARRIGEIAAKVAANSKLKADKLRMLAAAERSERQAAERRARR